MKKFIYKSEHISPFVTGASMTGEVSLKYSIGLKCLKRESFCLSLSLWLSIKLMGWRQVGRRKVPRTVTVMEAGLGVMGSGWV